MGRGIGKFRWDKGFGEVILKFVCLVFFFVEEFFRFLFIFWFVLFFFCRFIYDFIRRKNVVVNKRKKKEMEFFKIIDWI